MDKTILVIGSVTAEQYEEARLHVLRQGHKPKIVRVTVKDLRMDEYDLHKIYGGMDQNEVIELDDDTSDKLLKQYSTTHYEQYGEIASIIVSDDIYNRYCHHGSFDAPWYSEGYFDDIPLWRVHGRNYVELITE